MGPTQATDLTKQPTSRTQSRWQPTESTDGKQWQKALAEKTGWSDWRKAPIACSHTGPNTSWQRCHFN